jgi:hypothetical protein
MTEAKSQHEEEAGRMLDAIRDLIQEDVGHRGLRTDPVENLISACAGDFAAACRNLALTPDARVAVVTGFFIPHGEPPCAETDGPLGALFLARALTPLGIQVVLATDEFCVRALQTGLEACGLENVVPVVPLAPPGVFESPTAYWEDFEGKTGPLTHLIALERVGPSHTAESVRLQPGSTPEAVATFLREVPVEHHDHCQTMRGRDITKHMSPGHVLFEIGPRSGKGVRPCDFRGSDPFSGAQTGITTIGIGDGGNEIGMGKIGWDVIRRNIPSGGLVACRVPADHLIVCGISNWGAYGLAAGVRWLRGHAPDPGLFDAERERALLQVMVERGPLVDGVTGKPTVSVDGLPFEHYAEPLRQLGALR